MMLQNTPTGKGEKAGGWTAPKQRTTTMAPRGDAFGVFAICFNDRALGPCGQCENKSWLCQQPAEGARSCEILYIYAGSYLLRVPSLFFQL
jgi:hypothetical protein